MMFSQQTGLDFVKLKSEQLTEVSRIPLDVSILMKGITTQKNEEEKYFGDHQITLQIRNEYITFTSSINNTIIGGFRCDYSIKFQVIRVKPQNPETLGKPRGLKFTYKYPIEPQSNSLNNSTDTINTEKLQFGIIENGQNQLQNFVLSLQRKYIVQTQFHNSFRALKKIGKGVTACVYSAMRYSDKKTVAIKSFKRSLYFAQDNNNGEAAFKKQFKILTQINHPNICQLYGVYQTENSTYAILELLPLSLFEHLQRYGFPTRIAAKKIMVDLLQAIDYLHSKGIMHRDLKLENIMVREDNSTNVLPVVVDLGLAQYINSDKFLYTRCGTPGYVAPQVLNTKNQQKHTYSQTCDIFSLGVIFHILLLHKSIFEGSDVKEVIKKNSQCLIDFNNPRFQILEHQGKDLLMKMLQKDPIKRISARQCLSHPFLNKITENPTQKSLGLPICTQSI